MIKTMWLLLLFLASCGNGDDSVDAEEPDDYPPYNQYGNY